MTLDKALQAINGATHAEISWAAGRMLGIVYSLALEVAGGDETSARRMMADAFEEDHDLVSTQLQVITLRDDGI
jgi:hypothetical protein